MAEIENKTATKEYETERETKTNQNASHLFAYSWNALELIY